jgi:hypothetical protein
MRASSNMKTYCLITYFLLSPDVLSYPHKPFSLSLPPLNPYPLPLFGGAEISAKKSSTKN